jgi:hypothetical protein
LYVKVTSVRNCMDLVHQIIGFFSYSAARNHALQNSIKEVTGGNKSLTKLCETRFTEKHSSILNVLNLLPSLHLTFERLSQSTGETRETRQNAALILASLEKFEFVVNLQALAATSGLLVGISRSLQTVGMDIVQALDDVRAIKDILQSMRESSEKSFAKIFDSAQKLALGMNIEVEKPRVAKRSVYRPGAGIVNEQSSPSPLMGLVPAFITGDIKTLLPAIEIYTDLLPAPDEISDEFDVWTRMWMDSEQAAQINTAVSALQACENAESEALQLPNIKVLLQKLTTLQIENYFRVNMYIPVLDGLCTHLTDRFGAAQAKSLSLVGLVPAYMTTDVKTLQPAIEFYRDILPSEHEITAEFAIWKQKWVSVDEASKVKTAVAALSACKGDTLANIKVLLHILATLPVTTAEPERVFSKVERTATTIRSMEEERLEALVLLQSHRDRSPSTDQIINKFAMTEARRLQLII